MSQNKKYFYLKLKDNFFETDEMVVLESMPDGYIYSNILLKLYLRSLKNDGKLMFNDKIPFNSNMLSNVTRHSVGDVEKAVKLFQELNLIEVLENGAIYMSDIQNFIGLSTTEADRKRTYRAKITTEKKALSDKCPDNRPPELELEIKKEIKKEIELQAIAIDFLNYRKQIKKPIKTISGIKGFLKNLNICVNENLGTRESLIETMKENEWLTIKPEYISKSFKPKQQEDKNVWADDTQVDPFALGYKL